ncbi:MAG TPA: hypothetical protein VK249_27065 [Anaerolineales bacterium]|nr:hypothetical protein [Anaerolineales bacterium]
MKPMNAFCIVVAFALILGCTPPQRGANASTQAATAIHSPEAVTSAAPDNTPTLSKPEFVIQPYCPEVTQDVHMLPNLTGTLVLTGDQILINGDLFSHEPDQESLLVLWKPKTEEKTTYQLPGSQEYYYYVTSPDKEKLAFTQGKTLSISYDVIVLNDDGEESGKFTLPDDWNLFDWLNNGMLLVRQNRLQKDKKELVAVNPVNGEQQVLSANFPNLYSRETLGVWGALTIFDPTASFVLYLRREGDEVTSILWDAHNNKEIANITGLSKEPRWSADGKRLLIVKDYRSTPDDVDHDEIVIIKPEGDVTRATSFKANFEHSIINFPVWSPDARYVAFWLSSKAPIKTGKLAVLDTETSTVDLYCNELNPFPFRFGDYNTLGYAYDQVNSAPPIWSPDSKYLLIEDYQESQSSTYLFDLQNHSITKIADNARPVSWIK